MTFSITIVGRVTQQAISTVSSIIHVIHTPPMYIKSLRQIANSKLIKQSYYLPEQ